MHSIYATSFENITKSWYWSFPLRQKIHTTNWLKTGGSRKVKQKKDLIDCQGSSQVVYPDTEQKKMGSY